MNTPNTMTNEQINIKIAEICGWRQVHKPGLPGLIVGHAPKGYIGDKTHYQIEPAGDWWELPDYAADLNACHQAETAKEMHFDQKWIETIVEVALREFGHTIERTDGWDWVALVARLSARQRCEAFLRVHGQWEEEA